MMPDFASISAVLSSIKVATDLTKAIKESDISLEKAEIKFKLSELVSALAGAKIEIAEVQENLADKENTIIQLQKKLDLKEKMIWEKPYYWQDADDHKDGPYCQKCFDSEMKAIRLQGEEGQWNCYQCNNVFFDKNYQGFDDSDEPSPISSYIV